MKRTDSARMLSRVFHPFTVTMATLALAARLDTDSWVVAAQWTGLTLLVVIAPATMWIARRVRAGQSDTQVSIREHRGGLYATGILSILGLLVLLGIGSAPRVVWQCVGSALLAVSASALINRRTKISAHAGGTAGCAGVFFALNAPALGVAFSLIALATGWARVHLRQHTARQVILGWLVAAVSVGLVFRLTMG